MKTSRRMGKSGRARLARVVESLIEPLERRVLLSFTNVLVNNPSTDTTTNDTQSETALIAFGSTIVSAFNDSGSHATNSTKFTGWARSTDGGATFTDLGTLPTNTNGDAGDPVLARDSTSGAVYLSTLSLGATNVIQLFKSTDGGLTFGAPVNASPGFTGGQMDKEWLTVDNYAGSGQGNVYLMVRDFGTSNGIFVTRSTNGGVTWGPNNGVAITTGSNTQGSWITVGPDHSVYAFWYDATTSPQRIMMRKSTDQGQTFGSAVVVANLLTTGSNGDLGLGFRSNTFPQAVINPVSGNIYLAYDDNPSGTDRGDIYFTQSTNGGTSWSTPVRVNDDSTTNDQWQPALAVKPNGTQLFIGFYDRRNDPSNSLIDTYGTIANINGSSVTFQPNFKITTTSFPAVYGVDPAINSVYMGDYDQAAADNNYFYYTWGDNRDASLARSGNQANVRFAKISTGMQMVSTTPAANAVVTSALNDFVVNFSDAYDPATVQASDLQVNGISANSVTQTNSTTLTFHFNSSPMTSQGTQSISMSSGAIARLSDASPLVGFTNNFNWDAVAGQVVSTSPANGSLVVLPMTTLDVNFNEAVASASVDKTDLTLSQGSVTAATVISPTTVRYTLSGINTEGTLTVSMAAGAVTDVFGNAIAAYSGSFSLDTGTVPFPTPLGFKSPQGSMIYTGSTTGAISPSTDTDSFTISLDAGQSLTVTAVPGTSLQPSLTLLGPSNNVLASASGSAAGKTALLNNVLINTAGTYTISVASLNSTSGSYTVNVTLNAAQEAEQITGVTNNTIAAAESIDSDFISLGGGGSRAAVLGSLNSTTGSSGTTLLADFESGSNNFTVDNTGGGLWHYSTGRGSQTGHSATHSYYFGQAEGASGGGNYNTGTRATGSLISPSITIPSTGPQNLDFNYVLQTENNSSFDLAQLQISTNGGTSWTVLASYNAVAESTVWKAATTVSLGSYLGQTVKFRWFFDTVDSVANTYEGWYVDDIKISGTASSTTPDYYKVTLAAGDSISVALKALTSGTLTLGLYNSAGTQLAYGNSSNTNADQSIRDFVASTAGTYYLAVSGASSNDYSLTVTKDADFDLEPNDTTAAPQIIQATPVSQNQRVLGNVGGTATSIINFDELSQQSVDGLSLDGVKFGFSVNDEQSQDAIFGAVNSQLTEAVTGTVLQGNAQGVLTLNFDQPTDFLHFNFGLSANQADTSDDQRDSGNGEDDDSPAIFVQLFAADGSLVQNLTLSTQNFHDTAYDEGSFDYSGEEFSRAVINFQQPDGNFVMSNLSFTSGNSVDTYQVWLGAGAVTLSTTTPADGSGEYLNALDPQIKVYNAAGALIGSDDNSAADGRNALLNLNIATAGNYFVQVSPGGAGTSIGDYVLSIQNPAGTVATAPAFNVSSSTPASGAAITAAPSTITITFNDSILATSLQASDLVMDGSLTATAVTIVNDHTATFTVPVVSGVGQHTFTISAGAILDLQQTPISAFNGKFTIVTSPVTHFSWSSIGSTQFANAPFTATISALDANNNIVTAFNAPTTLSGLSGTATSSSIVISEVNTDDTDWIEFTNVSSNSVNISGWQVNPYDWNAWPNPDATFTFPSGTVVPAGGVFTIQENGTTTGTYPNFFVTYNIFWNNNATGNQVALMLRDSSGQIVDFFSAYDANPALITNPVSVPSSQWSGSATTANLDTTKSYSRFGNFDNNNSSDWAIGTKTQGTLNSGLSLPFSGGTTAIAISPTTATFTNGVWTGNVTVLSAGANVHLHVDDGSGHVGDSNTFSVSSQGLVLTLPSDVQENSGTANGTLSVTAAPASNLTVTLSSSDAARLGVPATLTIPAGQSSVPLVLTMVDNALLDGPESITISASATGFGSASKAVTVHDDESAILSVSLPSSAKEGDGTVAATITSSAAPTRDLTISLLSSNTSRVTLPATVTLKAGQTAAAFTATIVDNTTIDGTQSVNVTASMDNWTSGVGTISVQDNDNYVKVTLPASGWEGQTFTNQGTVTIGGISTSAIVVNLSSSDTGTMTLPSTVTIAAGSTSATFTVTLPTDAVADGTQTATASVSASGLTSGSATITVHDSNLDHLAFDSISSPKTASVAFSTTARAYNIAGEAIAVYASAAALSATGQNGTISISPTTASFSGGVLTTNVTANAVDPAASLTITSGGMTGSSNTFALVPGAVSSFQWSTISSSQKVNQPFPATLTAKDVNGYTVTNYTGTANLTGLTGSGAATTNILLYQSSKSNYFQSALTALKLSYTAFTTESAFDTALAAANPATTLAIAEEANNFVTLAPVPSFISSGGRMILEYWSLNTLATVASAFNATVATTSTTPLSVYNWGGSTLFNGVTSPMSFSEVGYTTDDDLLQPTGSATAVAGFLSTATANEAAVIIGNSGRTILNGFLFDDATSAAAATQFAENEIQSLLSTGTAVPISPTTATFAGGIWSGNITVSQQALGMHLDVNDGANHIGDSNSFDVLDVNNLTSIDLLDATDSGVSTADNITNFNNASPAKALQFSIAGTVPGALVKLYAGSVVVGSATATATTTTVTTDGTTLLADSSYNFSATQTAPGYSESNPTPILAVTIDTTAPAAPIAPDLQAASDSGISNTDNITNVKTPTFTVVGSPYFRFYRNGTLISGNYQSGTSYTLASQSDGTWSYAISAVDAAGNESPISSALAVTIDTVTPATPVLPDLQTASDSGMSNTDNITNINRPNIDLQSTEAGTVHLRLDGTDVASTNVSGAGTATFTIPIPSISFPNQNFLVSGSPFSMATADFNHDGSTDIVMGFNTPSNFVSVLLNNGSGSFTASTIPTPTATEFVTTADFNKDGNPDIVYSSSFNYLYYLKGNGDGTFAAATSISTSGAWRLTSADFNNDSKPDLAVMDGGTQVLIYQGNGDGTFKTPLSFSINYTGSGGYQDIKAADINNDGKMDLLVEDGSNNVEVFIGNGDGTFKPAVYLSAPNAHGFAVGDFNGDGKLDVVATSQGSPNVALVFLGNGDGTFAAASSFSLPVQPSNTGAVAADFNRDGKMDYATITASNSVEILYGNGDGTLQSGVVFSSGATAFGLVTADFNKDGNPDLALPAYGSSAASVLLNSLSTTGLTDGTHSIIAWTTDVAGNVSAVSPTLSVTIDTVAPSTPVAPDLQATSDSGVSNTDNITNVTTPTFDLATPGGTYYRVYRSGTLVSGNYGSGTSFTSPMQSDGTANWSSAYVDTAGNVSAQSPALAVTIDTVAPPAPIAPDLEAGSDSGILNTDNITNSLLQKFDLIGTEAGTLHLEVDGSNGTGPKLSIAGPGTYTLTNGGAIGFATALNTATGAGPDQMAIADFNLDGKPDAVVAYYSSAYLSVLLGLGNGTFQQGTNIPTGTTSVFSIATADFNKDGKPDLAWITGSSSNLYVALGNGDGTFQNAVLINSGTNPSSVSAQDVNQDGIPDLVLGGGTAGTLSVFLGVGNGTFQSPLVSSTVVKTYHPVFGDINGDGKVDVLFGDAALNVYTSLGNGNGTFQSPSTIALGTGGANITSFALVDLNKDGKLDLVAGDNVNKIIFSCLGNGDGTFQTKKSLAVAGGTGIAVGDVDQDGNLDVVASDYVDISGTAMCIALGNGDGSFRVGPVFTVGSHPLDNRLADLNGDGRLDILTANNSSASITVFMATGGTVSDGVHSFSAWDEDLAGNKSPMSAPLSVTIDTKAPTVSIPAITPNPRTTSVTSLPINFSEKVAGVGLSGLSLTRSGSSNQLTANQTVTSTDQIVWTLGNLSPITGIAGVYQITLNPASITDIAGNALVLGSSQSWQMFSSVAARNIFYNNSYFDGNNIAANASDDKAIATDKAALLPGQTASFANYTSYSKGINGIMIDVAALPGNLSLNDFDLKVGNSSTPSAWTAAPTPSSITMRAGAGVNGSTRVTIIWPDGAIKKQWLQVTLKADTASGLAASDVFYFGNAVGDTGNSTTDAYVNTSDYNGVLAHQRNFLSRASVTDLYDINRDSLVDATDLAIIRDNNTDALTALQLISVPQVNTGIFSIAPLVTTSGSSQSTINNQVLN